MHLVVSGPSHAETSLVLAHGAGAPMDSDYMNRIAEGLAEHDVRVVRFEFPYMAARREGRRSPPDRTSVLLKTFTLAYETERARTTRVFVGGKSMGGRIASMVGGSLGVAGVVCLGYPFRPPGKNEIPLDRLAHLRVLDVPALILQGERDPFGGRGDIEDLGVRAHIEWLPDGDHDMKPRKKSGTTHDENYARAIRAIVHFMQNTHMR